jgi:hypothetical protein
MPGPSELRLTYISTAGNWIEAIRCEMALATTDHSMVAMEHWDEAHLKEQDAQNQASEAREAYKDALRNINYGF